MPFTPERNQRMRSIEIRSGRRSWVVPALCGAIVAGWALERLVPDPNRGRGFAPDWLPIVAAAVAAAGCLHIPRWSRWSLLRSGVRWIGLLLLVWTANGLPFDLLTAAGLIGHRSPSGAIVMSTVFWPGLATRALAFAAAVVLARGALAGPVAPEATRAARWYAYAAFLLALPFPALRVHWALGGTLGLSAPGAAGEGWEPLLIAIPWVMAAVLSLLLVSPRPRIPRRMLLAAGWSATAIVAMIRPAALWSLIAAFARGEHPDTGRIANGVFAVFYGSWFLWAIAGGAATRAYDARISGAHFNEFDPVNFNGPTNASPAPVCPT